MKKFLGLIVICLLVACAANLANQRHLTRILETEEGAAPAASTTPQPAVLPARPSPVAIPVTDTIPPNPPNGMVFSGSGPFQLYRQGNLTWRLDTESGKSCILFATDAEWRKPRVYQQGCAAT